MAGFREGFVTGTQAGGFGKFFETLSGELSKAQTRREEEDIRRRKEDVERRKEEFQLQSAIEQITATGKQKRLTEAAKSPTIKRQAFESASKGEPLEGFTLEETKGLAGIKKGLTITGDEALFGKLFGIGKQEDETPSEPSLQPSPDIGGGISQFTKGQIITRGKRKFKVIDIDEQGPVFEEVK